MNPTAFFAEVMDKEPSVARLLLVALLFGALAFALARWSRRLLFALVPFAILIASVVTSEVRDSYVGPAILKEAGYAYIISAYVAGSIPFLGSLLGAIAHRRHSPKDRTPNQTLEPTAPSGRGSS